MGESTRDRLMAQGAAAFATLGLDRVNLVRDILEPAGVGPGSFYRLFADKTDLMIAVLTEAARRRMDYVLDIGSVERDDRIAAMFHRFFDSLDIEEHWWAMHFRDRGSSNPRVRERLAAGRATWISSIAARLAAPAPPTATDRDIARAMFVVAVGVIEVHFDQDVAARRHNRRGLERTVLALLRGGVPAISRPGRSSGGGSAPR